MSSVRQIAKRAGVSITTVSRVLNSDPSVSSETRSKILSIATDTGYVRSFGRRVTTQIAFLYTQDVTISHAYDAAVLEGAFRGLDEQRYDLTLLSLRRDMNPHESYSQFFIRKGVRGVLIRTTSRTRDECRKIADCGIPHVALSERFDNPNVCYIDAESKAESQRAVKYLIDLGHTRIAFGMHNIPDRDHLDRLAGYKDALLEAGLPFDDQLVFKQPVTLEGGASIVSVMMTMKDRPTALFFADPLLAVGATKQAHRSGIRVPEDLSIIGFDDTNVRYGVHPTLSAVCQDAMNLGFEAARWLTGVIEGTASGPLRKTLTTFLEINESTTHPPPSMGQDLLDRQQRQNGSKRRPNEGSAS